MNEKGHSYWGELRLAGDVHHEGSTGRRFPFVAVVGVSCVEGIEGASI